MRFSTLVVEYKLDPTKLNCSFLVPEVNYINDDNQLNKIENMFRSVLNDLETHLPEQWANKSRISFDRTRLMDGVGITITLSKQEEKTEVTSYYYISNKGIPDIHVNISTESHFSSSSSAMRACKSLKTACMLMDKTKLKLLNLKKDLEEMKAYLYIPPKNHEIPQIDKKSWATIFYDKEYKDWFIRSSYKGVFKDAYTCVNCAKTLIKRSLLEKGVLCDVGWTSSPFSRKNLLENIHDDPEWWQKVKKKIKIKDPVTKRQRSIKTELEYVRSRSAACNNISGWKSRVKGCALCQNSK